MVPVCRECEQEPATEYVYHVYLAQVMCATSTNWLHIGLVLVVGLGSSINSSHAYKQMLGRQVSVDERTKQNLNQTKPNQTTTAHCKYMYMVSSFTLRSFAYFVEKFTQG